MDLCSPTFETSTYKVKLWRTSKLHNTYVFTGGHSVDLGKGEIGLEEGIYHDDNVLTVLNKIQAFVTKSTSKMFTWIERRVTPSPKWLQTFADQILRGGDRVSRADLEEILQDMGMSMPIIPSVTSDGYTRDDIIIALKVLKPTKVPMPLGVNFTHAGDGYTYLGPTNPFLLGAGRSPPLLEITSDHTHALEHYPIHKNTIHVVMDTENLAINPDWRRFFFSQDSHANISRLKAHDDTLRAYVQMSRNVVDKRFKVGCIFKTVILRVHHSRVGQATNVAGVFETIGTNDMIPFIKLCLSDSGFRYKLHKPSMHVTNSHKVTREMLERWTNTPFKKNSKTAYVEFKVNLGRYHVSVRLHAANSHVDVRFVADEADFVFDDVVRAVPTLNKFFKYVGAFVDGFDPSISREFWKRGQGNESRVRILNIRSRITVAEMGGTSDLQTMRKLAAALVPVVMVQEQTSRPNRIQLVYKRSDSYTSTNNITRFIALHANEPDLLVALTRDFGITKEEAEQRIGAYKTESKEWATHKFLARISVVTINITRQPFGELYADVDGVENVFYHRRIVRLLMFLIAYGSPTTVTKVPFLATTHETAEPSEYTPYSTPGVPLDEFSESDEEGFQLDAVSEDLGYNSDVDDAEDQPEEVTDEKLQYVITMLRKADKEMFTNGYSRECQIQAYRQPIVVSPAEIEKIDKLYPGSYFGNYVRYGSTPKKMQENLYICPEVWCPLSRVSMTYEQFVAGKGCPGKEPPIDMSHKEYFIDNKTNKRKYRFVGFVGKGKCMPCCFSPLKLPQQKSASIVKINQCIEKGGPHARHHMKDAEFGLEDSTSVMNQTEKYIKGVQYPLDKNRLGLLPVSLTRFLPEMTLAKGSMGTGTMSDRTDMLVRRGISQSMLAHAVEHLVQVDGILERIQEKLSVQEFMSLNGGELFKAFVDPAPPALSGYDEFKKWLASSEYQKFFETSDSSDQPIADSKAFLRDFIILKAYNNFKRFLADPLVNKTEDMLLDLFNRADMDWMGFGGVTIVIIEMKADAPYLVLGNRGKHTSKTQYAFVVKQEGNYEPIVRARLQKGKLVLQSTFLYGDYAPTDFLIDFYHGVEIEDKPKNYTNAADTYSLLRSLKYTVRYQVVDYDFQLVGFVLGGVRGKGVFVPTHRQTPIVNQKGIRFLFVDELKGALPWYKNKADVVKSLLKTLHKITSQELFRVEGTVKDDDTGKVIALRCKSGAVVPMDGAALSKETYLDNLNMFIGATTDNARTIYMQKHAHKAAMFEVLRDVILTSVGKIHKEDMANALSQKNPFTRDNRDRLDRIVHGLMEKIVETIEDEDQRGEGAPKRCAGLKRRQCLGTCVYTTTGCKMMLPTTYADEFRGKLVDELLFGSRSKRGSKWMPAVDGNSSLVFSQADVEDGKLRELVDILENPYTFFGKALDVYLDEIVTKRTITPVDPGDVLSSTWRQVSTKLLNVTKKTYKSDHETGAGFCINNPTRTDNAWLVELFKYADQLAGLGKTHLLSERNVRLLATNSIITDYDIGKADFVHEFRRKNAYADHMLSTAKNGIGLTDLVDLLSATTYRFSEYELVLLSNMLRVNIVVFARKGDKRNTKGVKLIKPSLKSGVYVLLWRDTETIQGSKIPFDKYSPITKNKTDIVFTKETDAVVIDYIMQETDGDYLTV